MKTATKIIRTVLISAGLIASSGFIYGQETTVQAQSVLGSADQPVSQPDSIVRVVADSQGLSLVPLDQLPKAGTFWTVGGNGLCPVPYPCPPSDPNAIFYALGPDGVFLVDTTDGTAPQPTRRQAMLGVSTSTLVQAQVDSVLNLIVQQQTVQMNAELGVPFPSGSGDSGGAGSDFTSSYTAPNYGTNLWIANFALSSGNAVGMVSNTTADISYEIQYVHDLTSTQWLSGGFILGSELTNWTALVMTNALSLTNNLFVRIRSWASSDGSGLPDWWELQNFGYLGVDPYGNPMGDGWNNLYKFQHGMNPNVFYTPPAPQGLTVSYNANNNTAVISWQPSPGSVAGYTVTRNNNGTITTFNFSAGTTSFTDTTQPQTPNLSNWTRGPVSYNPTYQVQAQYTGGHSSASSATVNLLGSQNSVSVSVVPGAQNSQNLVVSSIPQNTPTIHITRMGPWNQSGQPQGDTTVTIFNIPITSLINGVYPLSESQSMPPDGSFYTWWAQTIPTNGSPSAATGPATTFLGTTLFYDGRVQLKQDLIFQLRAAMMDYPFGYYVGSDYYNLFGFFYPASYTYSGFYPTFDGQGHPIDTVGSFDAFLPFENNYYYRNLVFNLSDVNQGFPTTGIWGITVPYVILSNSVVAYQFQAPATNGASIPALLGTNDARWLGAGSYFVGSSLPLNEIGVSFDVSGYHLASSARNYFGLPFLSAEIAYASGGSTATTTLNAGGSTTQGGYFYTETAQPRFQTLEYDFWQPAAGKLPGMASFSPTNTTTSKFIGGVGQYMPKIVGYAKLAVTNGYSGVYAYLGQYFDQAYIENTNGVATTNSAGLVTPYGDFFPTYPGPAALVTMPDIDPPYQRGTCTVYCVSLALDKNHDGNMDLSWSGSDATSASSPMEFWVNSGNDKPGSGGNLDKDLPVPQNPPNSSYGQIRCQRNLENFARLWVCGTPALSYSQNNYLVNLTWQNVSSGSPSINIYRACETNGGIGYLTNSATAAIQTTNAAYGTTLYGGTVTNGSTFWFPLNEFTNAGDHHYLFEGAGAGSGELVMTITQNGNTIAQASAWLDLHDIKDFYERAVITNNLSGAISNWSSAVKTLQYASSSALGNDTNLIVFVHGINVDNVDWLDDSDTVFKRLYWAGFQGQFVTVDWPCNFFDWSLLKTQTSVFNQSEIKAYKASATFAAYLTQLRAWFAGYRLHLFVHSQGNAMVSEAIRQSGISFDTYILTQGALPASAYDVNAPTNTSLQVAESVYGTPESQPMGYRGIYTNLTGRIVNFYNTLDPVLNWWITDQEGGKPDGYAENLIVPCTYYTFDGANGWHHNIFGSIDYQVTDPEESRAMISRSLTLPIGQSGPASGHGVIQSAVDLHANFNFGNTSFDDHSAQWAWPIQTTLPYYRQILLQIQPTP
ncbi:MAG: alpha/beta hydrolase [Verrucomicrobiota bacterium]|jgi:hypothetical protein